MNTDIEKMNNGDNNILFTALSHNKTNILQYLLSKYSYDVDVLNQV